MSQAPTSIIDVLSKLEYRSLGFNMETEYQRLENMETSTWYLREQQHFKAPDSNFEGVWGCISDFGNGSYS